MGNEILNTHLLDEALTAINEKDCVKIVVTSSDDGVPHPAVKESLHGEDGNIVFLEYLESSITNRNMTRAVWFNKKVSVLALTNTGKSYFLTALPIRTIVSGKIFSRYYQDIRLKKGDVDLSAVWILKPLSVSDQSLQTRTEEENILRSHFNHLDRVKI